MKSVEIGKSWRGLSEEIIVGMTEWRQQNPKATFRAIEDELDRRLSELRARMLSDLAIASVSADWEPGPEAPVCSKCKRKLQAKGKKKRELQTRGGVNVKLEREYGICPQCGQGIFPLDEELELLPGVLSPHGHESLVRLACWMPFEKAAEMFEDLLGIQISKSLSERYTEGAGAAYESLQTAEVERLEREMPPAPAGADKLQVSADGAMVPLVHGQWVEVRTVVIGEVQPAVEERGEWVVHTRNLSYFSRRVTAEEFTRLALVEIQKRGIENAKEVGAVMDGADWLQGFVDYHCPQAVRILDFPHAGEHISPIGAFLLGEGTPEMKEWLGERLHQLKHAGPTGLLTELRNLQKEHPDEKSVVGNLAYLEKRENQMHYPQFQAAGWPIGSGIVESGNKVVVESRLKGAGMHWTDEHVNPMLALRNILCSDRWKADWPKIAAQLRLQNILKQSQQHQAKLEAKAALAASLLTQALPVVEHNSAQSGVEPKQLVTPHKPSENPWRKFKFGKALYQHPSLPKN